MLPRGRDCQRTVTWLGGACLVGSVALLMACSPVVGRDYQAPQVRTPDHYAEAYASGTVLESWWLSFHDDRLTALVDHGLAANLSVRRAFAHLAEVRAVLGVAESDGLPTVSADAGVMREGLSQHTYIPFPIPPFTDYQLGFDASWEIDLWGAVAREKQGALSDVQAQVWTIAAVQNTVSAEIVRTYYDWSVAAQRLALARTLVASYRGSLDIATHRLGAGLVTAQSVNALISAVAHADAALPPLLNQMAADRHALEVMLGVPPDSLGADLAPATTLPALPPALRLGIPADLLRRRPDVQIAERTVASATAREGVAEADLYPRLSLSGTFGLESIDREALFTRSALSWGIGPTIGWNLLDWGRTHHQIVAADRRIDEAIIDYHQTVLTAQQDVADALWAIQTDTLAISALTVAQNADADTARIERARSASGLSDVPAVNERQQSLLSLNDSLLQAEGLRLTHLVALAKALGGGWAPAAPPAESPTPPPATGTTSDTASASSSDTKANP